MKSEKVRAIAIQIASKYVIPDADLNRVIATAEDLFKFIKTGYFCKEYVGANEDKKTKS